MATLHHLQMGRSKTPSIDRGKLSQRMINSQPTSMRPQHTIPNVNAGELTQVEMGSEPIPNLYVREKNTANQTVEENTTPIQNGVTERYTV